MYPKNLETGIKVGFETFKIRIFIYLNFCDTKIKNKYENIYFTVDY